MPSIFCLLVLSVVQGLTEFLPVSSKTHLLFTQHFMGREPSLWLTIVLHAGSLLAILVYYWRGWLDLFRARRRELGLLVLATLPAVAAGLLFKEKLEALYAGNFFLASALLVVNGGFLFAADRLGRERHGLDEAPWWKILAIGLAQAAALLPGISRSGSTIGAGYLAGLKRQDAVRFSFFLGAVAVAGALVLAAKDPPAGQEAPSAMPILIGIAVTFAVSLAAIRVVELLSLKGRFSAFALYSVAAGVAGMVYFARG